MSQHISGEAFNWSVKVMLLSHLLTLTQSTKVWPDGKMLTRYKYTSALISGLKRQRQTNHNAPTVRERVWHFWAICALIKCLRLSKHFNFHLAAFLIMNHCFTFKMNTFDAAEQKTQRTDHPVEREVNFISVLFG